ncbi:hypothetical protein D3C78_1182510 [compost metagenome]
MQPFFLRQTRNGDNLQWLAGYFYRALRKAFHVYAHPRYGNFLTGTAHVFQPTCPQVADRQHHIAATEQLLIFRRVMVQHFAAGNINTVENGGDFAVNDPQLTKLRGGNARRTEMGNKDVRLIRLGCLPANRRQNQVARFRTITGNIQRFPG